MQSSYSHPPPACLLCIHQMCVRVHVWMKGVENKL